MTAHSSIQIVAGAGVELRELPPRTIASAYDPEPSIRTTPRYFWPHTGASLNRHNADFLPPHRSGNAAIRMSWDRLIRRTRWLLTNNVFIKRLTQWLTQQVVGEGISLYSAAIDHVPISEFGPGILNHPLFLFGDEADGAYEYWGQRYADVERKKTLYELQEAAAKDLFGTGNVLLLECAERTPEKLPTPTVCWQLLEAEQLDRTRDEAAGPGRNRVSNGLVYDQRNRLLGAYLYDVHPYDDSFGVPQALGNKSSFVPASRLIHLALTTRPSQDFGEPLANLSVQPAKDTDWLTEHTLTKAAIVAGLTLALKEAAETQELSFDGDNTAWGSIVDPSLVGYDVPSVREIGLASGAIATLGPDEDVKVIESAHTPNLNVVEFSEFLFNQMSMAHGVSFHRALGNPKGASFAALRAMMSDDAAMARPLTRMIGFKLGERLRARHDEQLAALGGYKTVEVGEYLRRKRIYQSYEVQGPPPQHLTQSEDVKASRARIESGMSTLRRECALYNMNWRSVLRQLALEKSVTAALGLALNFSSGGGGGTLDRSTTDAGGRQA